MARCDRCNACENQYNMEPCKYCGYPGKDIRTLEQKAEDDKDFAQYLKDHDLEGTAYDTRK